MSGQKQATKFLFIQTIPEHSFDVLGKDTHLSNSSIFRINHQPFGYINTKFPVNINIFSFGIESDRPTIN